MVKLPSTSKWARPELPVSFGRHGRHWLPGKGKKMRPGPGYRGKHFLRDAYLEVTKRFAAELPSRARLLLSSLPVPSAAMMAVGRARRGAARGRYTLAPALRSNAQTIGHLAYINPRLGLRRGAYGKYGSGGKVSLNWSTQRAPDRFALFEERLLAFFLSSMTDLGQQIRAKAIQLAHARTRGGRSYGKHSTQPVESSIEVAGPDFPTQNTYFVSVWINSSKWRSQEFGLLGTKVKRL